MGAGLYIHCPPDGVPGSAADSVADAIVTFLAPAAAFVADESGSGGLYLAFEMAEGVDTEYWVLRLREFLGRAGAGPGAYIDVLPPAWQPGSALRRIEVVGSDRWLTEP